MFHSVGGGPKDSEAFPAEFYRVLWDPLDAWLVPEDSKRFLEISEGPQGFLALTSKSKGSLRIVGVPLDFLSVSSCFSGSPGSVS